MKSVFDKEILNLGRENGFSLFRENDWSYVFKKSSVEYGAITFNVYWNSKNAYLTVQTTIDHPKRGRNQLNRKKLTIQEVGVLMSNPREHTGKGYYKK